MDATFAPNNQGFKFPWRLIGILVVLATAIVLVGPLLSSNAELSETAEGLIEEAKDLQREAETLRDNAEDLTAEELARQTKRLRARSDTLNGSINEAKTNSQLEEGELPTVREAQAAVTRVIADLHAKTAEALRAEAADSGRESSYLLQAREHDAEATHLETVFGPIWSDLD